MPQLFGFEDEEKTPEQPPSPNVVQDLIGGFLNMLSELQGAAQREHTEKVSKRKPGELMSEEEFQQALDLLGGHGGMAGYMRGVGKQAAPTVGRFGSSADEMTIYLANQFEKSISQLPEALQRVIKHITVNMRDDIGTPGVYFPASGNMELAPIVTRQMGMSDNPFINRLLPSTTGTVAHEAGHGVDRALKQGFDAYGNTRYVSGLNFPTRPNLAGELPLSDTQLGAGWYSSLNHPEFIKLLQEAGAYRPYAQQMPEAFADQMAIYLTPTLSRYRTPEGAKAVEWALRMLEQIGKDFPKGFD